MDTYKSTEAQRRAALKWQREKTKTYNIRLRLNEDADVIARLDEMGITQYIRRLVREDIEREKGK